MTESENPEEGQQADALRLPVRPLFETVVFPLATQPIQVGRQASLQAVDEAVRQASGRTPDGKRKAARIVLVTQQDASKQDVAPGDLMEIGVLAELGPMFRLPDGVAFLGINHELSFHAFRLQRMPELVGLRSGALFVAVAHKNEGRRAHILYVGDG